MLFSFMFIKFSSFPKLKFGLFLNNEMQYLAADLSKGLYYRKLHGILKGSDLIIAK